MDTRRRAGTVRIARNCWVDERNADDLALRCLAVLDSSALNSVIASVTAARLHGLWLPALPDAIHVATASPDRAGRSMTRTRRPELIAHRFQLCADEITSVWGVPVVGVARTWVHLGSLLTLPDLVAAGDSALRGGTSRAALAKALETAPGLRRRTLLVSALELLDARSRSRPESHLRVAVSAPDLPRFAVNEAIARDEGGWLAEPDLSLVAAKLALEYQGEDHAQLGRMRKDITRKLDLRGESWTVFEYGPAQVFERAPQIRAEVRMFLRD